VKYSKSWDKKLLTSFKYITTVKQPLKNLISQELWLKIENIARGNEIMDSILNCYYNDLDNGKNIKVNDYPAQQDNKVES